MKRRTARKILSLALMLLMLLTALLTGAFAMEDPLVEEKDTLAEVVPEQNSGEMMTENEVSAFGLVKLETELLANGFAGGSGTKSDPYLISTKAQLDSVRGYLGKHFKLTTDIEFADADFAEGGAFYNDGTGWVPIGDETTKFTGTFDGAGHTISGLKQDISASATAYGGLFGYVSGATIKNLGVINSDLFVSSTNSLYTYAGGIAGYALNGSISDCWSTGKVIAKSDYKAHAGGIAGVADTVTISNCYNTGAVSAISLRSGLNLYTYAGGLVGDAPGSTISDCYNTGVVSASAPGCITAFPTAGGIAGSAGGNISNCYNTGKVTATVADSSSFSSAHAGGIVGSASSNISDCYNTGTVSASVTAWSSSAEAAAAVGGIAGSMSNGNVSRCDNTGAVSASTPYSYSASSSTRYADAGGILGTYYNWDSGTITISECCNSGTVRNYSSELNTGGIVGQTYVPSGKINIIKCCNAGAVYASRTTQSFTGGIAGYHSKGVLSDCYSTGDIEGGDAGGIAGYVKSGSSVSNCYHAGEIKYCSYEGGIAGCMYGTGSNCYYLNTCRRGSGSGVETGTRCTDTQMKLQETFSGFDFTNTWKMGDGIDYLLPMLRAVTHPVTAFAGGRGTVESPYLISNTTQLSSVRKYPNAHFKMTADIEFIAADFSEGGAFYNDGALWQPIGDETAPFTGTFDGDGHVIRGLRINSYTTDVSYHGLFGYAKKATIKNVGMVNSDISVTATGQNYPCVGGIVGYTISGSVTNCYHAGSITVSSTDDACVGGIVGQAYVIPPYTAIEDCYNIGTVSVTSADEMGCVGGIGGKVATISSCYNAGSISMNSASDFYTYAGGIAGECTVVENCYNTGDISAVCLEGCIYVGGIAGEFATISNVYNTGEVSATHSAPSVRFCVGAIAGTTHTVSSTISNAYYLDNCENGLGFANVSSVYEACILCTVDQMKKMETFAGFDFTDTWTMTGNKDYLFPELTSVEMAFTKKAESVALTALPVRLEYSEGMPLDLTGGKITVFYNNGEREELDLSAEMISGYDSETLGVQTLTAAYGDFSTTFDITVRAKKLTSIEVSTLPDKVKYIRSEEELDLTGGILTLHYDNGTTEALALTADMTGAIDHSYAGEQMIAVFYESLFNFFEVTVVERTAIAVTAAPAKTTYLEGESLDLTGGALTVSYSDGSSDVIGLEHTMLSYDRTAIGDICVTVSYGGFTDTFIVEMVAKSAAAITVTAPTKITYLESRDFLDITGGRITILYNNDTSEEIALMADMVSGFDNTTVGRQTLTVTYGGFTDTFDVTILAKSLSSIAVTTLPERLVFIEGTSLNVTGGKITAYYDNSTSEEITLTPDMVSGFDSSVLGEQTLNVSYNGKTTVYTVKIDARSATSIAVTTLPDRLSYIADRIPLDVTGGRVTIYYNNGTSEEIDLTLEMVSGFDHTAVGTQTITVACGELETSYEITIHPIVVQSIELTAPKKLEYLQGAALDLTDGYLTVVYVSEDNYTEEIPLTDDMISNYNPEKTGVQTVFVTYEGKRAAFAVRVIAKSAIRIEVTAPEKLSYIEGTQMLDVTGGKVTVYYNNDTSEEIDLILEMVSGFDNAVIGRQTLTVSYGGFTDTFEVELVEKSVVSITVMTPAKTSYLEGNEDLDVTNGRITVYYNNGTSDVVDLTRDMVSGFENTVVGTQTLTVSYKNFTDTFDVEIVHDEVSHEAKAPTCTEIGWDAYVTCRRCDYTTYVEIPELGHSYADAVFEWTNDFSAVTASRVCHCGHDEETACTLEWTTFADGKLGVIAMAEFGEDVFREQKEITVSERDGVITVVLPDAIPGLRVLAATYAVSGHMIAIVPAEISDNTIMLFSESAGIRIFFLTADYCPITPVIAF